MGKNVMRHGSTSLCAKINNNIGDKSVETLGCKIRFLNVLETFTLLPPKTMLIFLFLRQHRPLGVSENFKR